MNFFFTWRWTQRFFFFNVIASPFFSWINKLIPLDRYELIKLMRSTDLMFSGRMRLAQRFVTLKVAHITWITNDNHKYPAAMDYFLSVSCDLGLS